MYDPEEERADIYAEFPEAQEALDAGVPAPKVKEVLNGTVAPEAPPEPEAVESDEPEPVDNPEEEQLEVPAAQPPSLEAPKLAEPKWYDFATPKPPSVPAAAPAETNRTYESKLVNKAPNWYDFNAPPEYDGNIPALIALAGGLIQAGVAPDKKSAIAMALGGVADAATVKLGAPKKDYDNRLEAAQKQAQMTATLRSGAGSGNDALGWARLDMAKQRMDAAARTAEEKARLQAALQRKDSPESLAMVEAAVPFMGEKARGLSGAQLMWAKSQYGQAARQDEGQVNRTTNFNRGQDALVEKELRGNEEHDRRFAQTEDATLGKEDREQQKLIEQASIEGWRLKRQKNGAVRAPNVAALEKARIIGDASERAELAANELLKIRSKLSPGRLAGKLYSWLGDDNEGKQALADSKIWQKTLMDAQRELSSLGVLQQFEKQMVEQVNPEVGTFDEFFSGGFNYDAYSRLLPKVAAKRMSQYGFEPDSGEEEEPARPAQKAPNAAQTARDIAPITSRATGNAIDAGKQVVKNVTGQVEQVAAPAKAAAKQMMITVQGPNGDWSTPFTVDDAGYKQWMQRVGLGKVKVSK